MVRTSPAREPEENHVVFKTTVSLRRLVPRPSNFRRHFVGQYSSNTAITTASSLDENDSCEERQETELARTLTTQNGTEAFYCPQQEARYLLEQGLEHRTLHRCEDALESLTQAHSLSHGSYLEPRILWALLSLYVTNFPEEVHNSEMVLVVLKPHMESLEDEWIRQEASLPLLNFLQEHSQWSTALRMALIVRPDDSSLARIYYENAASLTTQEAMPHLQRALSLCNRDNSNDSSLKRSILNSMVHAHAAEESWEEALSCHSCYMECLGDADGTAVPLDIVAQAHYDAADLHMAQDDYQAALTSLEQGLKLTANDRSTSLETQLLQAKAHVLYRLEKTSQALAIYKSLLTRFRHSPVHTAKLYYTMARICTKAQRYDEALEYFTSELKVTKAALGKHSMEVSRIHHDLARLYDDALGDYDHALKHYKKALAVERRSLKQSGGQEISAQILETQRCMGRIHYKRGDFRKAVTISFADDDLSSSCCS